MNANPRKTATSKTPVKSAATTSVKPQRRSTAKPPTAPSTPDTATSVVSVAQAEKHSTSNSKQSQLLTLLQSAQGATIEQMIEATGWQAHSIRGCISAVFRKKMGLTVERITLGTARVYRVAA